MSEILIDKVVYVRDDEKIEASSLNSYLSKFIDYDTKNFKILQFPSGFSNLTYLIKSGDQDFVLRRPPHGAKIKSGHDMSREFKILTSLKEIYNKSPNPIHYCENEDIIGSEFYIMERLKGLILRGNNYKSIIKKTSDYVGLSKEFVQTFVDLHKIDIKESGLIDFGNPEGYNTRQVKGWSKRYLNSKTEEISDINFVIKWLNDNIVQSRFESLIHNDFKYDNLVLDPLSLKVISVLDWEMSTIGDPFMDLGTSLAYWIQNDDPDFIKSIHLNITSEQGNPSRGEILKLYQNNFGNEIDNIVFYFTYGLFKIAVIVQQIYFRYKKGLTQDTRFKDLDKVVKAYGKMAKQSIQKNKIEYLF